MLFRSYHTIFPGINYDTYTAIPTLDKKFWKPLSASRASDTEKELNKLIKINFKAFRSTIHFIQNDFTGLTTSTPEKRKGILKDALNLIIYSKLEKIAKEKAAALSKQIDKDKTLVESLGDPESDLVNLSNQLDSFESVILLKNHDLSILNDEFTSLQDKINQSNNLLSSLEEKFSTLINKEKTLSSEKSRIETSIKEYSSKKSNVIKQASELIKEIKNLKEEQLKLAQLDFHMVDIISEEIDSKKEKSTKNNVNIQNLMEKLEELKIPMPSDNLCKHCRQEMSQKHRQECKFKIDNEIVESQNNIRNLKLENKQISDELIKLQQQLNSLNLSKKQLENINTSISSKNKEVADKKQLHDDYISLLDKFNSELNEKDLQVEQVKDEIKASSLDEANIIRQKIIDLKSQVTLVSTKIASLNKEINHATSGKAVVQHNIEQKNKDKIKLIDLKSNIVDLQKNYETYPYVIQGFSSTGIPNLIIQNVRSEERRVGKECRL